MAARPAIAPHDVRALPLYCGPVTAATASFTPRRERWAVPTTRVTVARELPWLDWLDERLGAARLALHRVAEPVNFTNAPIARRAPLDAPTLTDAWAAWLGGARELTVGSTRLRLTAVASPADAADTARVATGVVELAWSWPALAVVVEVRPWSSTRADLVLRPRSARRLRYPRRWFETGFALTDELRRQLTR